MTQWRLFPAWFAGAHLKILRQCESEITFYNALGLAALLISCCSGFAATVAASYVTGTPAKDLWFIGVGWALIMACAVERLVLQVPNSRKTMLALMTVLRVALSLLIGYQLAERVLNEMYKGEINQVLEEKQAASDREAIKSIKADYDPKIADAKRERASIRDHRHRLQRRLDEERYLVADGRAGCDASCRLHKARAKRARTRLTNFAPEARERGAELREEITGLRQDRADAIATAKNASEGAKGLAAREEALHELMRQNAGMAWEGWLLRALFIMIDLMPLLTKVLRNLAIGGGPYEKRAEAARNAEESSARMATEKTRADEEVGRESFDAWIEREKARIWDDTSDQIDGNEPRGDGSRRGASSGARSVNAWSLDDLMAEADEHEAQPVPIPPELRRGALVGLSLIGAVLVLLTMVSASTVLTTVVVAMFMAAVALAVYTRGFTRAPRWALGASFATLLVGLTLPILIGVLSLI
jgi:hypothetical protein